MRSIVILLVAFAVVYSLVGEVDARRPRSADPTSLVFAGHEWWIKSGTGGPGPNAWDPNNVFVDGDGALHLKLTYARGEWRAAEVWTKQTFGFGHYAFTIDAAPGAFDPYVMVGAFTYGGVDFVNEIDVELGRFGDASRPPGHFSVWPAVQGPQPTMESFALSRSMTTSSYTFDWSSTSVAFRGTSGGATLSAWTFAPTDTTTLIPQTPAPFYLNLWLFQGHAPASKQTVEVVIRALELPPAS